MGALTCVAALAGNQKAYAAALTTINLVFHGPFAFIIGSKNILVLTPENYDHAYTWYDGKSYYKMKGDYELQGSFVSGGKPKPDDKKSIVIYGNQCKFDIKDAGQGSDYYCSFQIPYPTSAPVPMRSVTGGDAGNVHFYGTYGYTIKSNQYPLVHSFSYTVKEKPETIKLYNPATDYKSWLPDLSAPYANLHIFAEPPCGVDDSHAQAAFTDLAELIHPNVADLFCRIYPSIYTPKPAGTGQVKDDETKSLEERCDEMGICPAQPPSAGVRIVNCMSVFVTDAP